MPILKFNLDHIDFDFRNETVYYTDNSIIVYRDLSQIICGNCNGTILSRTSLPLDYLDYQFLDLGNHLLFVFGGRYLISLHKKSGQFHVHPFDYLRIGRIITPIHKISIHSIIFGAKTLHGTHIVHYDFETQARIFQTGTSESKAMNDFFIHDKHIYSILDNYTINCHALDGKLLWTRFEMDQIGRGVGMYGGRLIYVCQNIIKSIKDKDYHAIQLPRIVPDGILFILGDNYIILCNGYKNICQYNAKKKEVEWEIIGNVPIEKSLLTEAQEQARNYKCIITMIKNYVGFINANKGTVVEYTDMTGVSSIKLTGQHLLVHKHNQTSALLESVG